MIVLCICTKGKASCMQGWKRTLSGACTGAFRWLFFCAICKLDELIPPGKDWDCIGMDGMYEAYGRG